MSEYEKRNQTEKQLIVFEAGLAAAMSLYFDARPYLERNREQERIFEGGFRLAWNPAPNVGSAE